MIAMLYGLPGCGKSTTAAYIIYCNEILKKRYEKKMNGLKGRFLRKRLAKHPDSKIWKKIYSNFSVIPFYTTFYSTDETLQGTVHISYNDVGTFRPKPNSLFIFEEAGIGMSSRNFKSLSNLSKRFAAVHRHLKCDCVLISQSTDVDKAYRDRCDCCFHLVKMGPFTWIHRLSHRLMVDESTHDITEGYFVPSFISSVLETLGAALFHRIEKQPMVRSRIIYRPPLYSRFDSYEDVFDYPNSDPAAEYPDYVFVEKERKKLNLFKKKQKEKLIESAPVDSEFSETFDKMFA